MHTHTRLNGTLVTRPQYKYDRETFFSIWIYFSGFYACFTYNLVLYIFESWYQRIRGAQQAQNSIESSTCFFCSRLFLLLYFSFKRVKFSSTNNKTIEWQIYDNFQIGTTIWTKKLLKWIFRLIQFVHWILFFVFSYFFAIKFFSL